MRAYEVHILGAQTEDCVASFDSMLEAMLEVYCVKSVYPCALVAVDDERKEYFRIVFK